MSNKKGGNAYGNSNRYKKQPESFFTRYKKRLIVCGCVLLAVIVTVIVVIALKNCAGDRGGDGDFSSPDSTLKDTLDLSDSDLYKGYFEDDIADITVECVSGTSDCYSLDGGVLSFTQISENSVYSVTGKLKGNIVIDVGDEYKFELELSGFSLVCDNGDAVVVKSGDKVKLTAKKDTDNYIYDKRDVVSDSDDGAHSGAVYSTVDLEIGGKGTLTVVSENNNGIHTKDDLCVKNLALTVLCVDNALKGNDSVTLENCNTKLIAKQGDGIKTSNSDISSKGKQRGTITIMGGTHVFGVACDGIDAAYDVVIDEETTSLTVYTDKYSSTSEDVTDVSSSISAARTDYTASPAQGGFGGGGFGGGGFGGGGFGGGGFGGGGMQDGNTEKGDHSTKGIKAKNEIIINSGSINIKSYDDAIHSGGDDALENGATPLGNITINGGTLRLYTNDDGIHADGTLTVIGGDISVENSYEGLEGTNVSISGGDISVIAKDDGINGTATSGTAIEISGGKVYIYCTGDGVDSNSRTSYSGIVFSGGSTVIISNSTGNSAIDTESGYAYKGGTVVAVMPQRGMANEAVNCSNFKSVGTYKQMSLALGDTVKAVINGATVSVTMPCSMSAYVIVLGDKSASIS